MRIKKSRFFIYILIFLVHFSLTAQTHTAVPMGNPVYHVIELAEMRGLCRLQPAVKPYSRAMILSIVEEILANNEDRKFGRLTEAERGILLEFRQVFGPGKQGLDLLRGTFFVDHVWRDVYFSLELGAGIDQIVGGGYYPDVEGLTFANETMPIIYFKGDLGKNASYGFGLTGGVFRIPKIELGQYNTYYDGFDNSGIDPWFENRVITTYSEPRPFFPYTYKKKWDGSVWYFSDVSAMGHEGWPQELSLGYSMYPELAGTLLNGNIFYRFARLDREWAGMTGNSSLVLNQSASPFFAGEIAFMPFPWFSFFALTGVLEYANVAGIRTSAETSQNAFSAGMFEVNYKNYLRFNLGSTAVWPKRLLELGYLIPLADNFLYQNNIGDFDNMAAFFNLQGQYPGLAKLWFSLFLDEMNPESGFFEKSRQMYAFQFGASVQIPWLSFTSLTVSYTKNEPYNYSHNRVSVPWYGDHIMETNYINGGTSLGHYIPPNSDEIRLSLDSVPTAQSMFGLQYQLIRHGADYGSRAVAGSSIWSELDPRDRSANTRLRKYFLRDGAYQWMHIFKAKGEYSLTGFNVPVKLFAEAGVVYSYFTDIEGPVNSGSRPYSLVEDNPEYPQSRAFIGTFGITIFPK